MRKLILVLLVLSAMSAWADDEKTCNRVGTEGIRIHVQFNAEGMDYFEYLKWHEELYGAKPDFFNIELIKWMWARRELNDLEYKSYQSAMDWCIHQLPLLRKQYAAEKAAGLR